MYRNNSVKFSVSFTTGVTAAFAYPRTGYSHDKDELTEWGKDKMGFL